SIGADKAGGEIYHLSIAHVHYGDPARIPGSRLMIREGDLRSVGREARIADPSRRRVQHLSAHVRTLFQTLFAADIADRHAAFSIGRPVTGLHVVVQWPWNPASERRA